jgi:signal recognition particle receptor subunit beta
LSGVPLLIFANKHDLKLSLDPDEIIKILELDRIKNRCWNIIASSAVNRIGLVEGFDWLKEILNSQN